MSKFQEYSNIYKEKATIYRKFKGIPPRDNKIILGDYFSTDTIKVNIDKI
jgi:hypothetical protein